MVNKSWDHFELNEMDEQTFLFWLDKQAELEELKQKAIEETLED